MAGRTSRHPAGLRAHPVPYAFWPPRDRNRRSLPMSRHSDHQTRATAPASAAICASAPPRPAR